MKIVTVGIVRPPDRADRVAAVALGHERGETADHVAVLVRREREADDVLEQRLARLVRERCGLHRVVDDRVLRIREASSRPSPCRPRAGSRWRSTMSAPSRSQAREVRDVVTCRARLERAARASRLPRAALAALERELVEALVVEAADVGDDASDELRLRRAELMPAALSDQRLRRRDEREHEPPSLLYVLSLALLTSKPAALNWTLDLTASWASSQVCEEARTRAETSAFLLLRRCERRLRRRARGAASSPRSRR